MFLQICSPGFCSPGQVVSMYSLLQNNAAPSQKLVEDHLSGNMCRCTGYRPILDAFQSFAADFDSTTRCCKVAEPVRDIEDLCSKVASVRHSKVDEFLREQRQAKHLLAVQNQTNGTMWFHPLSLSALSQLIVHYQSSWRKLVVGNTSIGIYKDDRPTVLIDIKNIPDLLLSTVESSGVRFGAALAITDLIVFLENTIKAQPSKTTTWSAIVQHMMRIANWQGLPSPLTESLTHLTH
jgi:xanthine dehydrogenase/oxidase